MQRAFSGVAVISLHRIAAAAAQAEPADGGRTVCGAQLLFQSSSQSKGVQRAIVAVTSDDHPPIEIAAHMAVVANGPPPIQVAHPESLFA